MAEQSVQVWRPEEELDPIERAVQKMHMVNTMYEKVMSRDLHYGTIPGTEKDTLLLPGAQKICQLFELAPRIVKETVTELAGGHREITMVVALERKKDGQFWGEGTGSCTSMESKFRYRKIAGGPVPQEYWDNRNDPRWAGKKTKKLDDGSWVFTERTENADIADTYNVIRKMCFKRALVSATITAAGISDIFNQDLEDMESDDLQHSRSAKPSGAPQGGSPSPRKNSLDFNALQAELAEINDLDSIHAHSLDLAKSFPNMTDKQKNVVEKIYEKRINEIEGGGA